MSLFFLLNEYLIIAKIIACVILILVISGYFPRFTGILHWYVSYSFFVASPLIDGGDQINNILTLLIIPITLFDKRKNHFSNEINTVSTNSNLILISFIFIIKIQVAVLYFHSAVAKFAVEEWINGTALYYWLLHPIHGASNWLAIGLRPLLENSYFVTFFTWGVMIFEIILSCLIFVSEKKIRYRKRMLVLGFIFHFFIFLIHGLPSFVCSMYGALLLFCLPVGYEINRFSDDLN